MKTSASSRDFIFEVFGLRTPRARWTVAVIVTLAIYVSPYRWLENLSLWKRLGLTWMPSIGLTRAYWRLLHGDFVGAWHRNVLIYPVVIVGICVLLYDLYTQKAEKKA